MTMMLCQKMVQPLRHICRDIRLIALLTYIRCHICDHDQFFPSPDFQRRLTRLQLSAT